MVTSLNSYGSFMSMGDPHQRLSRDGKAVARGAHRLHRDGGLLGLRTRPCSKDSFLKSFEAFILLLLAVFTPWSAINLVDYYCFTRSRYDVPALTDPEGRYGRWNATGICRVPDRYPGADPIPRDRTLYGPRSSGRSAARTSPGSSGCWFPAHSTSGWRAARRAAFRRSSCCRRSRLITRLI